MPEGRLSTTADQLSEPRFRELEVRECITVLGRATGTIIRCAFFLAVGMLIALNQKTPVYEASARVLLSLEGPSSLSSLGRPVLVTDRTRVLETEMVLLRSRPVRDAVRSVLGEAPRPSARIVAESDVIEIATKSDEPSRAADLANAYANAYIEQRRVRLREDLVFASQQIERKIAELQGEIDRTDGARRTSLVQAQAQLKTKSKELQVDAALERGGPEVVAAAVPPRSPSEPTPWRSGVMALVAAVLIGSALALLKEYLDDSVRRKEDLDEVAPRVPVLGIIPVAARPGKRGRVSLEVVDERESPEAEAYRTLATALRFRALDNHLRTVLVAAPRSTDLKTKVLANLGAALARSGFRVALVDCDLRRPRLHQMFDLDNTLGFTSVLLGEVTLRAAVQETTDGLALAVLPSGPVPDNPSELLSTARAVEILRALEARFDMVLVDAPPVLAVPDALLLSRGAGGILVVCGADGTSRQDTRRTVELLDQVDAPLIGAVLTGVTSQGSSASDYAGRRR